jgi:two-component system cell cycle response regulator CtrA
VEEGIDLPKLYDYDLISLDLVLPDIKGHDVLRVARNDTPFLTLSGETDTENRMGGFGSGADNYLTKPFHWE